MRGMSGVTGTQRKALKTSRRLARGESVNDIHMLFAGGSGGARVFAQICFEGLPPRDLDSADPVPARPTSARGMADTVRPRLGNAALRRNPMPAGVASAAFYLRDDAVSMTPGPMDARA